MKLSPWKKYFPPQIWHRGEDYALEGRVTELCDADGTISARVKGSGTYRVEIEYKGEEIISMFCTCPYAEGGGGCKHMAAVLYAWEQDPPPTCAELEAALKSMSAEALRKLLLDMAQKDSKLAAQLCPPKRAQKDPSWRRELDGLSLRYGGRDGFVDYYHAWDYTEAVLDVLRSYSPLLLTGRAEEAFDLTRAVYEEINTIDMDDSDGQFTVLLDACCEAWDDILRFADDDLRQGMRGWFMTQWEKESLRDRSIFNRYIFDSADDEALIRRNIEHLDRALAECNDYEYRELLRQKMAQLEKLPSAEAELAAFLADKRDDPTVRALFAERRFKAGDTAGAAALWEQNKADPNSPAARAANERLIELYEQAGDREKLADELREQVLTYRQKDLQYIKRLKELVSEGAWPILRETLLEKLGSSLQNQLLFSEGLYARLLENLGKSGFVSEMDRYEKALRRDYADELRAFYYEYLRKAADAAYTRGSYRDLMVYLRKLSDLPGGGDAARALAAEWRHTYSRRRAMLDELAKAGF